MECPPSPRSALAEGCHALGVACIYTVDVAKRLGTYRVEVDLLAAAAAKAAVRGETVTDVLVRALCAYIRDSQPAGNVSAPSIVASSVYTDVESPVSYDEPAEDPPCRHPADAVEANECGICHANVW